MLIMPKKIDPKVKERCVRLVLEHLGEYPSLTAAAEAVAASTWGRSRCGAG
jgi:hypothetical protein